MLDASQFKAKESRKLRKQKVEEESQKFQVAKQTELQKIIKINGGNPGIVKVVVSSLLPLFFPNLRYFKRFLKEDKKMTAKIKKAMAKFKITYAEAHHLIVHKKDMPTKESHRLRIVKNMTAYDLGFEQAKRLPELDKKFNKKFSLENIKDVIIMNLKTKKI